SPRLAIPPPQAVRSIALRTSDFTPKRLVRASSMGMSFLAWVASDGALGFAQELNEARVLHALGLGVGGLVAVADALSGVGSDGRARLRRERVHLGGRQVPALLEDALLLLREAGRARRGAAVEALGLARGELDDLLGDAHGAPVVAAHRAEV